MMKQNCNNPSAFIIPNPKRSNEALIYIELQCFFTKNEGQFQEFNNQECEYKIEGAKNDELEQGGNR